MKKILPRALLIDNATDPGMPYNSAEIMNIKNFSEGQICIKGLRQSEICQRRKWFFRKHVVKLRDGF